jgi:hypothetical protein
MTPNETASKAVWILAIMFLFFIAFWQSFSGVTGYIIGFLLGGLMVALAENKGE